MFLANVKFAFWGTQIASTSDLTTLIRRHGGDVESESRGITSAVHFVLSTHQMSSVIDDENKLQFHEPTLLARLDEALNYGVPVVDGSFLMRCVDVGRRLVPMQSELLVGVLDLVKRRRNDAAQRTERSTLDERVQSVLRLLFDEAQLQRTLNEMEIDPGKLRYFLTLFISVY